MSPPTFAPKGVDLTPPGELQTTERLGCPLDCSMVFVSTLPIKSIPFATIEPAFNELTPFNILEATLPIVMPDMASNKFCCFPWVGLGLLTGGACP